MTFKSKTQKHPQNITRKIWQLDTGHNAGLQKIFEHLYASYDLDKKKPSKSMKHNHGMLWSAQKRGGAKLLDSDGLHAGAWKDPGGIDRLLLNYEVVQTINNSWKNILYQIVRYRKTSFFSPYRFMRSQNFGNFLGKIKMILPKNWQNFGQDSEA